MYSRVYFRNEHRFLVKLCNKMYGIKSYRQCIELYRRKDHDRDIRIVICSNSATQCLRNLEIE